MEHSHTRTRTPYTCNGQQVLPHSNTLLSSLRQEGKREVYRGEKIILRLKSIATTVPKLPKFYTDMVKVKLGSQQLLSGRSVKISHFNPATEALNWRQEIKQQGKYAKKHTNLFWYMWPFKTKATQQEKAESLPTTIVPTQGCNPLSKET